MFVRRKMEVELCKSYLLRQNFDVAKKSLNVYSYMVISFIHSKAKLFLHIYIVLNLNFKIFALTISLI